MSDPAPAGSGPARPGLLRSNITVAAGTAVSRVTGLVRVAALAWAVGITSLADAFNLANNTPNIIYELLLGGILSAALVPLFTEQVERHDDEATSAIISVSLAALVGLSVAAVVAAPLIVRVYVPADDPSFGDTVDLARLLLPEILFYGWMALGSALLNARRRFFAPAWAPVLSNVVAITVVVAAGWFLRHPTAEPLGLSNRTWVIGLLGAGSTAGIALMAVSLVPAIRRAGVRLRWLPRWRHAAVRRLLGLSGWTIGYVMANQVALIVVYRLARGAGGGDLSAYVYAFTFFQLPHGLLAVSIMTTFGPELARSHLHGDERTFAEQTSLGLRFTALFTVIASAGYLVLGRPLVSVLLERGLLGSGDAEVVADTLVAFAVGLVGFSCYLFVLRAFYSRTDARTPFLLNLGENALNIVLALVLVGRFGVVGLALAFALAYLVAAVVAFAVLARRVGTFDLRPLGASLARLLAAGVVAGGAMAGVAALVGGATGWGAVVRLAVGAGTGLVVYGGMLFALRAPELDAVRTRLLRRPGPGRRLAP